MSKTDVLLCWSQERAVFLPARTLGLLGRMCGR
jgi:hypothetical protein